MPAYYDSMEMRRRHGIPPHALMAAYLEMVDTSRNVSKFWSCYIVSVSVLPDIAGQCRIHYHWGRIGTEGQRRSHGPMYRPAAIAKAHSMIESKLHKGYASSSFDHADYEHYERRPAVDEDVPLPASMPIADYARIVNPPPERQRQRRRRKTKTKQRPVQADRFILLEDDDDA